MEFDFDEEVVRVASQPSFVQHFSIIGLFGYRTITLDSSFAATILIAKNGAGKTTMLGALDAFLRCQFGRLASLDFERIECKLKGLEIYLTLNKSDLDEYLAAQSDNPLIAKQAKAYDIDPADLLFFILWEYPLVRDDRSALIEHPVFYKIYHHSSHTFDSTRQLLNSMLIEVDDEFFPIHRLRAQIYGVLKGIEIVYLPTYRRIELSLPESDESKVSYRRQPSVQTRLGLTRRGLHVGDIQFGLADISARLRRLNQDIMSESNQKYAEISANIIDDLISGAFELAQPNTDDWPSREELDIFFDRLKSGRREYGFGSIYGPYGPVKIPDLARIYGGNIPANSEKFLTYFLGKLNSVIKKTRETERLVESFVSSCNKYLSALDPSSDLEVNPVEDGKVLKLNRATLDVSVWRSFPESEIPLDALSSGEKQMISLFARLYLYPGKKLVLIDEPELSLSLDWQRKILPDILRSDSCAQVVAITHSPFIFDNELDAYAKPLGVRVIDSEIKINGGEI